jgi:hypothetical protein
MGRFEGVVIRDLLEGARGGEFAGLLKASLLKFVGLLKASSLKLLALLSVGFVFLKEYIDRVETFILLRKIDNPQLQKAALEMSELISSGLRDDYVAVVLVLSASIIVLILSICLPLLYKGILRPRLNVFISFNNAREDLAETLQTRFHKDGTRVSRVPFDQTATHQRVVMSATDGIKKCDSFVCLPGLAASYVEHEVFAATTSTKPVVFLISEKSGTLPNTADKRYPVFRLEVALREQFSPLLQFIYYIGADLKSTWEVCKRALRHPYMQTSVAAVCAVVAICFGLLFVYCFYRVSTLGEELTKTFPLFIMVKQDVVLTHFFIFIFFVSISFLPFSYSVLCNYSLLRQFRARKKARLKTVAAEFNRDDWIGIIPGLLPGTAMYECLFESAPLAHHESGRKEDAV